jgi:hypothetical protein
VRRLNPRRFSFVVGVPAGRKRCGLPHRPRPKIPTIAVDGAREAAFIPRRPPLAKFEISCRARPPRASIGMPALAHRVPPRLSPDRQTLSRRRHRRRAGRRLLGGSGRIGRRGFRHGAPRRSDHRRNRDGFPVGGNRQVAGLWGRPLGQSVELRRHSARFGRCSSRLGRRRHQPSPVRRRRHQPSPVGWLRRWWRTATNRTGARR